MNWKHIWVWLLLLTISAQWIGGVVYVKLNFTALIERAMDGAEAALAEELAQEYGIESQVRILDEEEQQSILNIGYGSPFIFSRSGDDSTDFFTLEEQKVKVVESEYLVDGPEKLPNEGKALLSLQKLFSPYIIDRVELPKPVEIFRESSGNFAYNPLKDLFSLTVPTPPPSLA